MIPEQQTPSHKLTTLSNYVELLPDCRKRQFHLRFVCSEVSNSETVCMEP